MANMVKPTQTTLAQFTGADRIIAQHNASKLVDSTAKRFGPGKITLAEAAGLSLPKEAPSLAGRQPNAGK